MIRFKINKKDLAALPPEYLSVFIVAAICLFASLVVDSLWARDIFIAHTIQLLFVFLIVVVYLGGVVSLFLGILRPSVFKGLARFATRNGKISLEKYLARQNPAKFKFIQSVMLAVRRWFVFTSLWIILLSYLILLVWERYRTRFALVVICLVALLLNRKISNKLYVFLLSALSGIGAWFMAGGNDYSGQIILLGISFLFLSIAFFLKNDSIKPSKPLVMYIAGVFFFFQIVFGVIVIEKKFFGFSADLPRKNMAVYPSKHDMEKNKFSLSKWWEIIHPSMSYTKSQIYDFDVSIEEKKVYFIDKEKRQVGYVRMKKNAENLEWTKKHYGWMEQLIVGRKDNLPDGELTGSIFVNYHGAPMELDADTLEKKVQCPNPSLWHNVPVPYWWQRTIDIKPLPHTDYIAGIIESTPYFYVQHAKTCEVKAVRIKTGSPYQVLCSEKRNTCYVSGWRSSNHLSEIKFDPTTLEFQTRAMYVGPFAMGMDFNSDHSELIVPRPLVGTIDVIDTETFQRIRRIPSVSMVRQLAYCPTRNWVFAAHFFNGNIHVYDYQTGKHLGQIKIGNFIRKVYWDQQTKSLFANDNFHVYQFSTNDILELLYNF